MAPPVGKGLRSRAMHVLRLLLPFPGRLEFAVRLAVICALTAFVAELYETPEPALTVYVAFFLIKPDRVTSIVLSFALLGVLTVTLLIVLAAAATVADDPIWRVGVMSFLSCVLMFLASASKLRAIAPIMALIAAYALDLLGTIQIGEIATRALLYAWLFVGIPAGVSILVNLLGGPAPRRLAEQALAHRLLLAAGMLRGPTPQIRAEFSAALHEGIGEILTWLRLAGLENTSSPDTLAAFRQGAGSVLRIMLLADIASRHPQTLPPLEPVAELAATCEAMAAILASGSFPIEINPPSEQPDTSAQAALWQAAMRNALVNFAKPPTEAQLERSRRTSGGFLAADAFTNPVHVHHALKTTGAAIFCYVLYSLLNWPTIHTCLITCYIVSLGTAAETVEKLSLRIFGCLLGATAGIIAIVFLVPSLTSIGGLLITVFLATMASAWIAAGDLRISYVGFQAAFAFYLCVLQGSAPSFDMVTARDRVIGILLGNAVTYLVFTNIWPVSVTARIDPSVAALLRSWSAVLRNGGQAAILAVSEALAAMGMLERDLELTAYEPRRLHPQADWLDRRRRAAGELAGLEALLWLSTGDVSSQAEDAAARLERLADRIGKAAPVGQERPAHVYGTVDAGLRRLERLLEDPTEEASAEPGAGQAHATP
jgi:multidrug resistance protein MdtO